MAQEPIKNWKASVQKTIHWTFITEISSSYNIYAWVKNSQATGSRSESLAAYNIEDLLLDDKLIILS